MLTADMDGCWFGGARGIYIGAEVQALAHRLGWDGAPASVEAEDYNEATCEAADYLDSLNWLDAACAEHGVEFILPAHGYVLGDALGAIAKLKAHRLAREAKVLAAMQALPGGSMDDWVRHAYDDVPPRMWPVAQRSLLAHVERIRSLQPGND